MGQGPLSGLLSPLLLQRVLLQMAPGTPKELGPRAVDAVGPVAPLQHLLPRQLTARTKKAEPRAQAGGPRGQVRRQPCRPSCLAEAGPGSQLGTCGPWLPQATSQ